MPLRMSKLPLTSNVDSDGTNPDEWVTSGSDWILADLARSGIDAELAKQAGIVGNFQDFKNCLGYDRFGNKNLSEVASYGIPYPCVYGENGTAFFRVKLREAIKDAKYLSPKAKHFKVASHLYIILSEKEKLTSSKKILLIVEGEKKALAVIQALTDAGLIDDYCVIGISGINQWLNVPEWEGFKIRIKGRDIFICLDADGFSNPDVRREELKMYSWFTGKGANVRSFSWDPDRGKGIDDFMVAGGDLKKLVAEAVNPIAKFRDRPTTEIIDALGRIPIDKNKAEILAEEIKKYHKISKKSLIHSLTQKSKAEKNAAGNAVTLPGGGQRIQDSGAQLGKLLAEKQKYFNRGGEIVILEKDDRGDYVLKPLSPAAAASTFETVADLHKFRDGEQVPATCSKSQAELILASGAFRDALPKITLLSPCPVITEKGGELVVVCGYDPRTGILANGEPVEDVSLLESVNILTWMFNDFRFASDADKSRAVAAVLTVALTHGGFIKGRAPVDLGEADESQTGKGYRNKLNTAIYRTTSAIINQKARGVGSLEESFNSALIYGASIICIDNVRGKIDSPAIESFLTEDTYRARMPHRADVEIDPRKVIVQMTSNRAEITKDLANRSSCVRILKQIDGYQFEQYPEGDILEHIRANQPKYLGAVFTVIREWHRQGKPIITETRHDFRAWAQPLTWIVSYLFGQPFIMDGHRATQTRMTNPALTWLREVALTILQSGSIDWMRVNQIVDLLADADVNLPGLKKDEMLTDDNIKTVWQQTGRKLGKCFLLGGTNDSLGGNSIKVDGILIERGEEKDFTKGREVKTYRFSRFSE